jgi:hypothetical protein
MNPATNGKAAPGANPPNTKRRIRKMFETITLYPLPCHGETAIGNPCSDMPPCGPDIPLPRNRQEMLRPPHRRAGAMLARVDTRG